MYLERLPEAFEVGELNSQPDLKLLGKDARIRRLLLLALQPATCILVGYTLSPGHSVVYNVLWGTPCPLGSLYKEHQGEC